MPTVQWLGDGEEVLETLVALGKDFTYGDAEKRVMVKFDHGAWRMVRDAGGRRAACVWQDDGTFIGDSWLSAGLAEGFRPLSAWDGRRFDDARAVAGFLAVWGMRPGHADLFQVYG